MNIEEWQKKYVKPDLLNNDFVILASDFRDLLKTHAIVPREPTQEMILATSGDFSGSQQEVVNAYKAMIQAAENG